MKILHVSPYNFVRGGADRVFVELSALLEARGHEVLRLCVRHSENAPAATERYFVRGIDTSNPLDAARMIYNPDAARQAEALIAACEPDVAHLHIYYGHFTGTLLRALSRRGLPIVQTVHDYKPICPTYSLYRDGAVCELCQGRQFWRAAATRCNRGSLARSALSAAEAYVTDWLGARSAIHRYIAVGEFQARKLAEYGVPADRIVTLHNFVDPAGLSPAAAGTPRRDVVYFGRLDPTKNVRDLVEAFAGLSAEARGGARLRLAGTGAEAVGLAARVAELGDPDIEMLGFVGGEALRDLVRSAVCTVLTPRWYENCSMAVLESLAMGTPVIAGRIGCLPELVEDGVDGLVVPSGDASALRDALAFMLADRGRAAAMGAKGAEKIRKRFSPQTHYEALSGIYRAAIAEASGATGGRGAFSQARRA